MPNLPAETETNPPADPRKTGWNKKITPRLKKALRLVVTRGMNRDDAAREAGISESTLYKALKRKNVQEFIEKIALDLRDHDRHKNFQVLRALRDDPGTTPYVRSDLAKYLDGKYEPRESPSNPRAPANVVIVRFGGAPAPAVDVTPGAQVIEAPTDATIARFGDQAIDIVD